MIKSDRSDSKLENRREQILDAATDCFREYGFHGTSISNISKAANMSVGHIYHYFENKEAIIAAIVDRNLERELGVAADLSKADKPLEAMLALIERALEEHLNPKCSALQLEVMAEATRNDKVAEMLLESTDKARKGFSFAIRETMRKNNIQKSDKEIENIIEFLGAIFNGLTLQGVRNPHIDRDRFVPLLNDVICFVIGANPPA